MTDKIDTKAIMARADAATGYSWSSQGYSEPEEGIGIVAWPEGYHESGPSEGLVCWATLNPTEMNAGDPSRAEKVAAFIAHAREDIPALCRAYDEQAKEIERLRGLLKEASGELSCLIKYGRWTCSDESPGHHPTFPSAISRASALFTKLAKELEP